MGTIYWELPELLTLLNTIFKVVEESFSKQFDALVSGL